ncbi:hypothetical protein A9Q83_10645 [Alphaproteobacteria bacterium 46_93_T64]|nr:hypothetical protein A9Q83_10645 [Alphaproteobacteria bacterium 46_93_T64]
MRKLVSNKKAPFSFAAAVGAGMTAIAAEKGGAEFLLLLNAGRLRMRGGASLGCYLPLEDANSWIDRIGRTEVLNKCKIPVLMGCSVANPNLGVETIVETARMSGFSGVTNFPTAVLIDGKIRDILELQNIGFGKECELIKVASQQGLQTLAYVSNNTEASMMVAAGADMLCINIGFTHNSSIEASDLTIDNTAKIIDRALKNIPLEIPTYVEGGPITTPEFALAIYNKSRVQGYIAGSTIDRFPLEETIVDVAKSYRIISQIKTDNKSDTNSNFIHGSSKKMREIQKLVGYFGEKNDPVLIVGPSGSGKSLLAEEIHRHAEKNHPKLIHIDCLSLSPNNSVEELFGTALGHYGKGTPSQAGILEDADQATVVFEEISALSLEAQAKIVNFVDTGNVHRMGGDRQKKVRCRIIATTNESIDDLLEKKLLRKDLYYRLNAVQILIPALKDRAGDIPHLAKEILSGATKSKKKSISNSGFGALLDHDWPGNVRELKNAINRACLLGNSETLKPSDFSFLTDLTKTLIEDQQPSFSEPVSQAAPQPAMTERDWIADALQRNKFKRGPTAEELGITTRTLYSKIKKYSLYSP